MGAEGASTGWCQGRVARSARLEGAALGDSGALHTRRRTVDSLVHLTLHTALPGRAAAAEPLRGSLAAAGAASGISSLGVWEMWPGSTLLHACPKRFNRDQICCRQPRILQGAVAPTGPRCAQRCGRLMPACLLSTCLH